MTSDIKDTLKDFSPEALTQAAVKMVKQASADWKGSLLPVTEGFSSDKSLADELYQWSANDGNWYRRYATPIINKLKAFNAKGTYDKKKAVKLWQPAAVAAADMYAKAFGSSGSKGKDMFPAKIIKMVAIGYTNEYDEEATG